MKSLAEISADGPDQSTLEITGDRVIRLTTRLLGKIVGLFEEFDGGAKSEALSILCYAFPDWFSDLREDPDTHEETLDSGCGVPANVRAGDAQQVMSGSLECREARVLSEILDKVLFEYVVSREEPRLEDMAVMHVLHCQLLDPGDYGASTGRPPIKVAMSPWLIRQKQNLTSTSKRAALLETLVSAAKRTPYANDLLLVALSKRTRRRLSATLKRLLRTSEIISSEQVVIVEALMCLLSTDTGTFGREEDLSELAA